MGYRCPVCMKDFGVEKEKWSSHCQVEHFGAAKIYVDTVKKIARGTGEIDIIGSMASKISEIVDPKSKVKIKRRRV